MYEMVPDSWNACNVFIYINFWSISCPAAEHELRISRQALKTHQEVDGKGLRRYLSAEQFNSVPSHHAGYIRWVPQMHKAYATSVLTSKSYNTVIQDHIYHPDSLFLRVP